MRRPGADALALRVALGVALSIQLAVRPEAAVHAASRPEAAVHSASASRLDCRCHECVAELRRAGREYVTGESWNNSSVALCKSLIVLKKDGATRGVLRAAK